MLHGSTTKQHSTHATKRASLAQGSGQPTHDLREHALGMVACFVLSNGGTLWQAPGNQSVRTVWTGIKCRLQCYAAHMCSLLPVNRPYGLDRAGCVRLSPQYADKAPSSTSVWQQDSSHWHHCTQSVAPQDVQSTQSVSTTWRPCLMLHSPPRQAQGLQPCGAYMSLMGCP